MYPDNAQMTTVFQKRSFDEGVLRSTVLNDDSMNSDLDKTNHRRKWMDGWQAGAGDAASTAHFTALRCGGH